MGPGREPMRLSYQAHERGYEEYRRGSSKADQAEAWLDPGTVNSWRFDRMYDLATPVVEVYPDAQWLTVGDGRYGLDAIHLQRRGARALPTESSALFRQVRARIARYDLLCSLGVSQWGLLGALILKQGPSSMLRAALERHGFDLAALPANPYLLDEPS